MKRNQSLTFKAMWVLGDHFSRLGGSCRPSSMAESEIQLYVSYKLLIINDHPIDDSEFANKLFLQAADSVIEETNALLAEVKLSRSELIPFVLGFYEYADGKLSDIEKTERWARFGEYLKATNMLNTIS